MERDPQLQGIIATLQRRFGSRSVQWGMPVKKVHRLPVGISELDALLGGIPRGHITEWLGAPTSGMTTIALRLVAHTQAHGELAAWLDLADAFDAEYAAYCGVNLATLLLAQPATAYDALELLRALVDSRAVGVLITDQLNHLQAHTVHAQLLSTALHALALPLADAPTALVALSTVPYPLVMVQRIVGHGSILAHAAALRIHVARAAWPADPLQLGCNTHVLIIKDKLNGRTGEAVVALDFEAQTVQR